MKKFEALTKQHADWRQSEPMLKTLLEETKWGAHVAEYEPENERVRISEFSVDLEHREKAVLFIERDGIESLHKFLGTLLEESE
jgi:hypothetical protein